MLLQKAEFLTIFKSLESMGLWKISEIPKEECVRLTDNFARRMQVCLQHCGGHFEPILERIWLLYKGNSMTETMGMVVHRLKFETCKVLEVYWNFVGFNKTFMGSVFFGSPCNRKYVER